MPKAKTNKSVAKRLKVTGTGKLMRRKQGRSHILTKKSSRRKRRLERPVNVAKQFLNKFKKLIVGQ